VQPSALIVLTIEDAMATKFACVMRNCNVRTDWYDSFGEAIAAMSAVQKPLAVAITNTSALQAFSSQLLAFEVIDDWCDSPRAQRDSSWVRGDPNPTPKVPCTGDKVACVMRNCDFMTAWYESEAAATAVVVAVQQPLVDVMTTVPLFREVIPVLLAFAVVEPGSALIPQKRMDWSLVRPR
jgi:hypothetical protein